MPLPPPFPHGFRVRHALLCPLASGRPPRSAFAFFAAPSFCSGIALVSEARRLRTQGPLPALYTSCCAPPCTARRVERRHLTIRLQTACSAAQRLPLFKAGTEEDFSFPRRATRRPRRGARYARQPSATGFSWGARSYATNFFEERAPSTLFHFVSCTIRHARTRGAWHFVSAAVCHPANRFRGHVHGPSHASNPCSPGAAKVGRVFRAVNGHKPVAELAQVRFVDVLVVAHSWTPGVSLDIRGKLH